MAKIAETPLMKQYLEMKKKHPDAILLFRVGDFYETFSEDAKDASAILGITLTRRANGAAQHVELAGFPHHALDTYLPKLVRAGRRVAICEQLEDPKTTKKLVKRGITELVTPGVNTSESSLRQRDNNFLGAIHFGRDMLGVAFLDITTGEFLCARGDKGYVDKLLTNIAPREILRMHGTKPLYEESLSYRTAIFELDDWVYTEEAARERLISHFDTASLKGFGVDDMPEAIIAAGAVLRYMDLTNHNHLAHITTLARIEEERYVRLDRFTIRNLELISPMGEEGKSLLEIIDKTSTPMGVRMLRRRLLFPLIDTEAVNDRLDMVEYLFRDPELRAAALDIISPVGDIERLVSKLSSGRIAPREILQLRDSIEAAAALKQLLAGASDNRLNQLAGHLSECEILRHRISTVIRPDAPAALGKGATVAEGVNAELDELRRLAANGKQALDDILAREIENTGIPSLKISFNNVFGYYIEVRNTHRDKVPQEWIRKQTLVSAERYITPELKEYEQKITGAEERIAILENSIYTALLTEAGSYIAELQGNSTVMAQIDCLLSAAISAAEYNYTRPTVDNSTVIDITDGRHPVIERRLPPGEPYIANSLTLDCDRTQIMMITGPNMSGKSALLRQTALIALMAQTGHFVPASAARIGVVDKIFTRVGASDNISSGESTFMVEMNEAAAILNNMSERSLILFDELGRGTSTYDGISIAWAIVQHIHENGYCRPRTLFATHYHELNDMANEYSRISNFNVSVEEIGGKVVFLRKLRPGGSAHSFGIHVARLAGMPRSIVVRADAILRQLESSRGEHEESVTQNNNRSPHIPRRENADAGRAAQASQEEMQLSFFQLDDPLLSQIRDSILELDIDNLTPLQALTTLHNLKGLLTGK